MQPIDPSGQAASSHAASDRAVAQLVALVRQACAPGGVGPHEFARPGGWRQRGLAALACLGAAPATGHEPLHLFEIVAEAKDGTYSYFVSAPGSDQTTARAAAVSKVVEDVDGAAEDDVVGAVNYHGIAQREIFSCVGPYAA